MMNKYIYPLDKIYSDATGVLYPVCGAQDAPEPTIDKDYFYIKNISDGVGYFQILNIDENRINIEYSLDYGENWTSYDYSIRPQIKVDKNKKIYFRGDDYHVIGIDNTKIFNFSKRYEIGGNLLSIVDYNNMDSIERIFIYYSLFYQEKNLISSSKLNFGNSTIIATEGVKHLFDGCVNLLDSPHFENISFVSGWGLGWTFQNCSSLITPPDFSNITDVNPQQCFDSTFKNCTSLRNMPDFSNLTRIGNNDFLSTFSGCVNLENGVDLRKLTTISQPPPSFTYFFREMYKNCYNLKTVCAPNIDFWDNNMFKDWLLNAGRDIVGEKIFYAPAGLEIPTGVNGIPSGWTRIDY